MYVYFPMLNKVVNCNDSLAFILAYWRKSGLVSTVFACVKLPYYCLALKTWLILLYLLGGHSAGIIMLHVRHVEVKTTIAFTVTVCIGSFEVIGKL